MTISPQTAHIAAGLALVLIGLAAVGAAARLADGRAVAPRPTAGQETFTISGRVLQPLLPGTSGALNLRLTNRHRYALQITRLFVSLRVDAAHARAGCDRATNFRIQRVRADQYPIRLGPRRTRSLQRLGVRPLPRVIMRMLATNQDACKNARIALRFSGHARRWKSRVAR